MTKNQLTLLTLLADGYSISAAAREMRITQPHASRMLSGMESHMGIRLVLRRGQSVTPTEELHAMAKYARKALANIRAVHELAERMKQREEV